MNELVPFTQDAPYIGSIVLEETNLEGEEITNVENNNALMLTIL